jgi:hypothetical protein
MSKSQTIDAPPTVARRFLACTQSRGGIGKSTVAETLITWLNFAGVPYGALDADRQNQTLSKRYPGNVKLFEATKSESDFLRFIRGLPDLPVIVVDFPAQATDLILSYAEHYGLKDHFENAGIRPTFLIFAADDSAVKLSGSDTVQFFMDSADYILIENPARFESDVFKKTPLFKWLLERKTPTLRLPPIATPTIEAWEALERKLKRYLPLEEASKHPDLYELSRHELQYFRDRVLAQFDGLASRLVPDIGLIKNKVPNLGPLKAREKSDLLTDAWLGE